jgi:ATP adenylyltransferase
MGLRMGWNLGERGKEGRPDPAGGPPVGRRDAERPAARAFCVGATIPGDQPGGYAVKREKHHIVADKLDYARGKRPPVDCILCAVARDDPRVDNLRLYRHDDWYVTLNLYPYNPGHLMIVPATHYEDLRELNDAEVLELHRLQVLCLRVLERVYHPGGYNVGYNMGAASGASIEHIHLQIVPRYRTEVGFFDILSDSRVIVEEPQVTRARLQPVFAEEARMLFGKA